VSGGPIYQHPLGYLLSLQGRPAARLRWRAALGLSLPEQHVTISALSLVIQDGPERDWHWSTVGVAKLGPSSTAR
jgi:hypothetical protein